MATSTAIFDVEIVSNQLFEEIGKREARTRVRAISLKMWPAAGHSTFAAMLDYDGKPAVAHSSQASSAVRVFNSSRAFTLV